MQTIYYEGFVYNDITRQKHKLHYHTHTHTETHSNAYYIFIVCKLFQICNKISFLHNKNYTVKNKYL